MSNKKYTSKEIALSRVSVMLLSLILLSVLTYLYIMPFKKHFLQINVYYMYIEYAAMAVTFVAFICSCVFAAIKRKNDYSQKIITPNYFMLLSFIAFAAAVIIPLSANRTLASKYAVIVYLCIFIAYTINYYISKAFAYTFSICAVYCILFSLSDVFFNKNVTFNDAPIISYTTYLTAFCGLTVLAILVTYFVSKSHADIKLWHVSIISLIADAFILTRIFVFEYISLAAVLTLIAAFVILIIIEKNRNKISK